MGINKNFTLQSSAPAVSSAASAGSWATYYANSSGILRFVHPNATDYVASTFFPDSGIRSNVTAVSGFLNAGAAVPVTGIFYGGTGVNPSVAPRVLGEPSMWIKAFGPNGELIALPAYTRIA